nr:bacteriocin immunity protein [uncultured Lachnoclostridium sp.]
MSENLSKQELIDLVEVIMNGGYDKTTGKKCSEEEHFQMVVKFKKSIKHPGGSDLIYYPEDVGLPRDATAEQIVDLAMKGIDEAE